MNAQIFSLIKNSAILLTEISLHLTNKAIELEKFNDKLCEAEDNFRKECKNISIALTKLVVKYGKTG